AAPQDEERAGRRRRHTGRRGKGDGLSRRRERPPEGQRGPQGVLQGQQAGEHAAPDQQVCVGRDADRDRGHRRHALGGAMPESKREIIANVARLHQHMDRHRLAAVVARSGQNFTYLSGIAYPGTLARLLDLTDSPRGVMVFWPRNGEPSIILNKTAEPLTRRDSWIKQLELYEGYSESPYSRLCAVIKKAGLARERIGIEKNFVSAAHWEEMLAQLPQLQLIDCTKMMDEVRWIKTRREIVRLKEAADLLDEAYLDAFRATRPGDSERKLHGRIVHNCLDRGAGWVHGILASSTNTVNYGGEGDTVFQRGDIIRDDYVAYCAQGYPGHQSRNVISANRAT